MSWLFLITAGLLEIGWPLGLKYAQQDGYRLAGIAAAVLRSQRVLKPGFLSPRASCRLEQSVFAPGARLLEKTCAATILALDSRQERQQHLRPGLPRAPDSDAAATFPARIAHQMIARTSCLRAARHPLPAAS